MRLQAFKIKLTFRIAVFFVFFSTVGFGQLKFVTIEAKAGNTAFGILHQYQLTGTCNIDKFKELNSLDDKMIIKVGVEYKLPALIYTYNGTSIRSTISNNDWELAVKIQNYNDDCFKRSIKKGDYRKDKILWVPYNLIHCDNNITEKPVSNNKSLNKENETTAELFGNDHTIKVADQKLKGCVYYLVSGHGGPDPGAMGKKNGKSLCEDEYAYDVTLRLAKRLMEHGAIVYMIIRDTNDGIRNQQILDLDKDETCYPEQRIPLDQVKRLKQRADAINKLYLHHKKQGIKYQRLLVIHVDSRISKKKIDMFFYYNQKSSTGKKFATGLRDKVEEKYNQFQKNRGYTGTSKPRNLYMLRETLPTAAYLELGNISNSTDQKRLLIPDNRAAIAKWLCDGMLEKK